MNEFDLIAPFYDTMARLIFGNQLLNAQIFFLEQVQAEDKVLIIGGGTGELLKHMPGCDVIHFVEKSSRMMKAASKHPLKTKVEFINEDFLILNNTMKYDLVICPFFLDCFDESTLEIVIEKIRSVLKTEGHLLVADFQRTDTNRLLLKSMHLFFRLLAKLQSKSLLDIHEKVSSSGFRLVKEKISHRNQLFSRLYRNL
ncbi:MAG: class I SAM-dependent methyltransferase [Ekhidna sp.]